ncbi:GNAT family N-acetyltransferase [Luteimonas sp. FCS-9]|uniref:GNAT family N-acetyltransferase n=1 Tax=Luteimonas sp. FCS-9 TaxID=1547516 RepID=UPI00063ECF9C|nr:GNAT family N-acetyltransferase [Luteimonas sp. FCS-9]KLJ01615.1 phosphinothricin acetyltransferase [Luteimonas sp. FCS-9]
MAAPAPGVLARDAHDGDLDAIAALYAREVRDGVATYEYDAPDTDEMRRRWSALRTAGYPYLVAELDGRFAGYAYAGSFRSRIGYRFTVESSVYVAHALHGHGVGRVLMEALIAACAQRGFRQMMAVIGPPQGGPSVRFHERLGFQTVGVLPGSGRKHGRWLDTILMQRALGDGATTPPEDE